MTSKVKHRGPDDEGYVLFAHPTSLPDVCAGPDTCTGAIGQEFRYSPKRVLAEGHGASVALGHRRLSIIDPSPAGHQPMCNASQRYWIVFNGEIYNHIELRRELEHLGHRFHTDSDTEVILASYEEWGEDCLARFLGMWGFAIYDRDSGSLFLARDRFGIKPLYYWTSPDETFYFASEIKQFTVASDWRARGNAQRTYDFLAWGLTDHTDETLFAQVMQLRPGHSLRVKAGDRAEVATPRCWYELKPAAFEGSPSAAANEFKSRFFEAVRLHLRSDVPIGSCLSGGLDSSSIVCVMNQLLQDQGAQQQQMTFSACSNHASFDERFWIDKVVAATNLSAQFVYPTVTRLFDQLAAISWHQDEPFLSSSVFAQWSVFELAANYGVKVMLDGQGADEQLAGYHSYFGPRFATLLRAGKWRECIAEMSATSAVHHHTAMHTLMITADALLPEFARQPLRALSAYSHTKPRWLDLKRLGAVAQQPYSFASRGSVQALSHAQLTGTNLQMLLHWEDRDSMAHSVESRVPFLDHRLVEFALGLPDELKIASGITKRVQRAAMMDLVPEPIRLRVDKMGFVTPEEIWVREEAADLFRTRLEQAVQVSQGIIRDNSLEMFEAIAAGRRRFSSVPWRLISFGEWVSVFQVQFA